MIGMILCGHGKFASGMYEAVQLIGGSQEGLVAIDFTSECSEHDLQVKLTEGLQQLKDYQNVVICTDLLGGSPFKNAVTLTLGQEDKRVIYGSNLSLILEMAITRNSVENFADWVNQCVEASRESLGVFTMPVLNTNDVSPEDGI